jgi:hypothetical protein
LLNQKQLFLSLTQVGMIGKLKLVAHKDLLKSVTIVFNVRPLIFLMLLLKNVLHVQLIIHSTMPLKLVTVKPLVNYQENLMLTMFVNAQLIKKELKEYSMNKLKNVFAHQTYHSGMVNIVLPVQQELNMIQKKDNVIIVQKDLSEMLIHMPVFQVFDFCIQDLFSS